MSVGPKGKLIPPLRASASSSLCIKSVWNCGASMEPSILSGGTPCAVAIVHSPIAMHSLGLITSLSEMGGIRGSPSPFTKKPFPPWKVCIPLPALYP